MANLVLKNGKYYGYDTNGGRLYDLDTLKYIDEKKPVEPVIEVKKENADEKPLEKNKDEKKNK